MTTLLLIRHGETDWNAEGRLQGHTDRPLNDHGRRQAAALAERLAGEAVAAVYSSDLARARETAEILAERLGLPVVDDPDLRERNWGNWEGLRGTERNRIEYVGEAQDAHAERVIRAVRRIAELHPGERIVVVTHGGSLRRIQVATYGMALPVADNCSVWAVAVEDGTFRSID
ncbi:MAG TPA: histidine phosphatase family protein [Gaiellaceae bacterium]